MKISVSVDATTATVNVPFKFQIKHVDVPQPTLIRCKVVDDNGSVVEIALHPQSGQGIIDVLLTPLVAIPHFITLSYDGSPVSGKSEFKVNPEPYAAVIGEQDRDDGVVGDDYSVQVQSINVKIFDFKFAVKGPGPQGGPPVVVASLLGSPKDQGISTYFKAHKGQLANPNGVENGIFDVTFKPKFAGTYSFLAYLHGKPLAIFPVVNISCLVEGSVATGKQSKVVTASEIDTTFTSPRAELASPKAPQTPKTGPIQITATSSPNSPKSPVQIQATTKPSGPVQISSTNMSPKPTTSTQVPETIPSDNQEEKPKKSHSHRSKEGGERTRDKPRTHKSKDKK